MESFIGAISPDAWAGIAVVLFVGCVSGCIAFLRYYVKTHDLERRYTEKCAAYEHEKTKAENLQAALDEQFKVKIFRHWLYLQNDPEPRVPICPQCWSENKITRMFRRTGNASDIICYECARHRVGMEVNIHEQSKLLECLGDKPWR